MLKSLFNIFNTIVFVRIPKFDIQSIIKDILIGTPIVIIALIYAISIASQNSSPQIFYSKNKY